MGDALWDVDFHSHFECAPATLIGDSEGSLGILTGLIGVPRRFACDRIAYTTRCIVNVYLLYRFECFGGARIYRSMLAADVQVVVEAEAAKEQRILK